MPAQAGIQKQKSADRAALFAKTKT